MSSGAVQASRSWTTWLRLSPTHRLCSNLVGRSIDRQRTWKRRRERQRAAARRRTASEASAGQGKRETGSRNGRSAPRLPRQLVGTGGRLVYREGLGLGRDRRDGWLGCAG